MFSCFDPTIFLHSVHLNQRSFWLVCSLQKLTIKLFQLKKGGFKIQTPTLKIWLKKIGLKTLGCWFHKTLLESYLRSNAPKIQTYPYM